jgi:multidrug efflux system membrane fusion protein
VNTLGTAKFLSANLLAPVLLPALLALASCSSGTQGAAGGPQAPPAQTGAQDGASPGRGGRAGGRGGRGEAGAVPVTTALVTEASLPVYVQGVGNVEAFTTVEIRPQITGPLLEVNFREGQDVEKGQLLFTIDPRPFELAVKQAEAQLAKDAGQSKTAETQRTRYTSLLKSGLVAQSDYDTVAAQGNSLLSTLSLDEVAIENAKLQLQYTKITAPIAGRTGALQVHVGSQVHTTDAAPMVVLNQITPVLVTFSLPAVSLPDVRTGQGRGPLTVEVTASGDAGTTVSTGSLTFIDNMVDATTAAIKLKATLPNQNRKLWPGEFVQVRLRVSEDPHAIVVPTSAVQNGPQGQYAYVIEANRSATLRPIKVARNEANSVVIASGLKAGEEVVTDGQLRLTPGARVSVKQAPVGGQ